MQGLERATRVLKKTGQNISAYLNVLQVHWWEAQFEENTLHTVLLTAGINKVVVYKYMDVVVVLSV